MGIIKYIAKLEKTLRIKSCINVALIFWAISSYVCVVEKNREIRALKEKIEEGKSV